MLDAWDRLRHLRGHATSQTSGEKQSLLAVIQQGQNLPSITT